MTDQDGLAGLAARAAELPARYFVAVAGIAAALLGLAQSRWAGAFGLAVTPPYFRLALTTTALLCGAVAALKLVASRREHLARKARGARLVAARQQALETLSPQERTVLVYYALHGRRTFYAEYTHGVLQGLAAKGLVSRPSGAGSILTWPHVIEPVTWDYITTMVNDGRVPAEVISPLRALAERDLLRRVDPLRSMFDW